MFGKGRSGKRKLLLLKDGSPKKIHNDKDNDMPAPPPPPPPSQIPDIILCQYCGLE